MVKETIEQFNKLQGLDSRIFEIETQLAKIPVMLQESLNRSQTVENARNTAQDAYDKGKSDLLATEATLAEQNSLLASAQKKLTSVQNNKEYEAALKELDSLRRSIATSEEQVKTLKDSIHEIESTIVAKTEEAATALAAYESEKAEKEAENKSLFDEIAQLKKQREEFAKGVKKGVLSKYERIRSARHNVAIAPVVAEVCTGCNMKIPPQLAVEVKKEKELLQCPYCQRFLYSDKEEVATAEAS